MSSKPVIRDATCDDLAAIVAIYNTTIPSRQSTADLEPVSVDSRRQWFEEHSPEALPIWVVDADEGLAAWLSFNRWNARPGYAPTAEVAVYVHPGHRRKGLARFLLERAIECSPALGLRNLIGIVFAHNEPSVKLFESLGFRHWGLLPRVTEMDGVERDVAILGRRVGG
jgi:phosphinothricin acetyltransferase